MQMNQTSIQSDIRQIIEEYKSNVIDRNQMTTRVKEMFYSCLMKKDQTLETIRMYYFMHSIIDCEELNNDEFTNEINSLYDTLVGNGNFSYNFVIRLNNDHVSADSHRLCEILYKVKENQMIEKDEYVWYSDFCAESQPLIVTLEDLLINKIRLLLNFADDINTDKSRFIISNMYYTQDEIQCTNELFEIVCRYIECLEGKRDIFMRVTSLIDSIEAFC